MAAALWPLPLLQGPGPVHPIRDISIPLANWLSIIAQIIRSAPKPAAMAENEFPSFSHLPTDALCLVFQHLFEPSLRERAGMPLSDFLHRWRTARLVCKHWSEVRVFAELWHHIVIVLADCAARWRTRLAPPPPLPSLPGFPHCCLSRCMHGPGAGGAPSAASPGHLHSPGGVDELAANFASSDAADSGRAGRGEWQMGLRSGGRELTTSMLACCTASMSLNL